MEGKIEMKFELNGDVKFEREIIAKDTDGDVVMAMMLSGMEKLHKKIITEVKTQFGQT